MNGDFDGVPVHGARLLVVEDDPEQRDMMARALRSRGYRVRTCGSASEAILLAPAVEVVLLDVRLPDRSGWHVVDRLNEQPTVTSVVFVTGLGDVEHRVRAWEAGASAYLTKPFLFEELALHIEALLRRKYEPGIRRFGSLFVDLVGRRVELDGSYLYLRRLEYDLLTTFVQYPNRVFDRDALLSLVWGADAFVGERTVDARVKDLRVRLRDQASAPRFIETAQGIGYRWIATPDDEGLRGRGASADAAD